MVLCLLRYESLGKLPCFSSPCSGDVVYAWENQKPGIIQVFRCYLRYFGSNATDVIKFLGKSGKDLSGRLLRFLKVTSMCSAFCDKIDAQFIKHELC